MSKVNWVVAGIGDIARKRVIPAIQSEPRSTLYGFVTRNPAKAAAYPGARTWPSIEEAIADPAVQAVYLALPVALHAEVAIKALRAGKHVLCEKPMAMNFAQAVDMVAKANAAGRLLGVSYYRRLYPKLLRAKHLIAEGAIGKPVLAEGRHRTFGQSPRSATATVEGMVKVLAGSPSISSLVGRGNTQDLVGVKSFLTVPSTHPAPEPVSFSPVMVRCSASSGDRSAEPQGETFASFHIFKALAGEAGHRFRRAG